MTAKMNNFKDWITCTDPQKLFEVFNQMLLDSGFKVLKFTEHHFQPQGYTALFLLAESHFAIHTFPEENRTYIELSSCVDRQYDNFLKLYTTMSDSL